VTKLVVLLCQFSRQAYDVSIVKSYGLCLSCEGRMDAYFSDNNCAIGIDCNIL